MSRKEFTSYSEYQKVAEFKHFPSENYKTIEYEKALKEYKLTLEDSNSPSFSQKKEKKKKSDENLFKSLKEKLSNITQATTSVVATSVGVCVAVVGFGSSIITPNPEIVVDEVTTGVDFVSFEVDADGLSENLQYNIIVSNNSFLWESALEEGSFETFVEGLSPNQAYDIKIVGVSQENVTTIYYKSSFYTKNTINPSFNFDLNGYFEEKVSCLDYDIFVSDYYNQYSDYYVEFINNDEVFFTDFDINSDNHFTGSIKEAPFGEVLVNVYGKNIDYFLLDSYEYYYPILEDGSFPLDSLHIYNPFTLDDVIVDLDYQNSHQVTVLLGYDSSRNAQAYQNPDLESYYKLLIYHQNELIETITSSDSDVMFEVSQELSEINIEVQFYMALNGEEKLYETYKLDETIDLSCPIITLSDPFLSETSQFSIPFSLSDSQNEYDYVEFKIEYPQDDYYNESVIVKYLDVIDYFNVSIYGSLNEIVVTPIGYIKKSDGSYNTIEFDAQPFTFEYEYKLNYIGVDYDENTLKINLHHYLPDDYKIVISDGENTVETDLYYATIDLNGLNYTYYLVDGNGVMVGNETSIEIQDVQIPSYTFDYSNPSNVLKSFNEDGTHNLYMNTNFSCDDTDVYYEVTFTNEQETINYVSQDPIVQALNLTCDQYSLNYRVYKVIDGIYYEFKEVTPSGTTFSEGEEYIYTISLSNDGINTTINIELDTFVGMFDINNSFLRLDENRVLQLNETDFTDESGILCATYTVEGVLTLIESNIYLNNMVTDYEYLSSLIEIQGSVCYLFTNIHY